MWSGANFLTHSYLQTKIMSEHNLKCDDYETIIIPSDVLYWVTVNNSIIRQIWKIELKTKKCEPKYKQNISLEKSIVFITFLYDSNSVWRCLHSQRAFRVFIHFIIQINLTFFGCNGTENKFCWGHIGGLCYEKRIFHFSESVSSHLS